MFYFLKIAYQQYHYVVCIVKTFFNFQTVRRTSGVFARRFSESPSRASGGPTGRAAFSSGGGPDKTKRRRKNLPRFRPHGALLFLPRLLIQSDSPNRPNIGRRPFEPVRQSALSTESVNLRKPSSLYRAADSVCKRLLHRKKDDQDRQRAHRAAQQHRAVIRRIAGQQTVD